jgi:hypothetical protein
MGRRLDSAEIPVELEEDFLRRLPLSRYFRILSGKTENHRLMLPDQLGKGRVVAACSPRQRLLCPIHRLLFQGVYLLSL